MCSSSGRPFVLAVSYGMLLMNLCKQASRWEDVLGTSGFPDDEQMMIETCRRHEELN